MDTLIQNGSGQLRCFFSRSSRHPGGILILHTRLAGQYITLIAISMSDTCVSVTSRILTATHHQALLYYDYALTFARERRLFWSWGTSKQWGSVLFFLNRYCGVIGHAPVVIEKFTRPKSTLYLLCGPLGLYHQALAIIMQTIVGCMSSCISNISYSRRDLTRC